MIDSVGNWLAPEWMTASSLADYKVGRVKECQDGCRTEYAFCRTCGGKMYRTTHVAAPIFGSPDILGRIGLSHISSQTSYYHECDQPKEHS